MTARISYKLSYRQQTKVQILTILNPKGQYLGLVYFKNIQKKRMSEKCRNNKHNSDNPLTSRRTDGGKNDQQSGRSGDQSSFDCYVV